MIIFLRTPKSVWSFEICQPKSLFRTCYHSVNVIIFLRTTKSVWSFEICQPKSSEYVSYHLVNAISFSRSQSDYIKRRLLFQRIKHNFWCMSRVGDLNEQYFFYLGKWRDKHHVSQMEFKGDWTQIMITSFLRQLVLVCFLH